MKNIVSIDELRTNLAELIGRVMYGKNRIVIKKYNREAAILLSIDEYEKLVDPTKRLTKDRWRNKFKTIDEIRDSIPEIDQTVLEKKIAKAIKSVREKRRAKSGR